MPCPNCSHTVQNLGLDQSGRRTFWCPRCGGILSESPTWTSSDVPKWTKPLGEVPLTTRLIATLAELVNSAFSLDAAKELLREIGAGEVYEAVGKTCAADGRPDWSQANGSTTPSKS